MNFTVSSIPSTEAQTEAIRLLTEVYSDKPFTGTGTEMALIMMMMLNKQGSVGVEEILCRLLGLIQNREKHGFDGQHPETKVLYELKPGQAASATYNDVTPEKIRLMTESPNNKVIFEVHLQGKVLFIAQVSGKNVAKMLLDRYLRKKKKILLGEADGTRQTHTISLTAYVKEFGTSDVEVLFYNPHIGTSKLGVSSVLVKTLGLTVPVNKLQI